MAIGKALHPKAAPTYTCLLGWNTCHIRVLCRTKAFTAPCTAGLPWIFAGERYNLCPINLLPTFGCSVKSHALSCETKSGDSQVPEALAMFGPIDLPTTSTAMAYLPSKRKALKKAALVKSGLPLRHLELDRAVPMYKTNYRLCPVEVFGGHMVVSMRPYRLADLEGGLDGAKVLGITDLDETNPDFGGPTEIQDGEVAVYFGCGVTPQLSVMDSGISGEVSWSHAWTHADAGY
ncbi:DUF1445-domain-containing protein [Armillaria gallica]|uniref:DUF1445-domain-containing protein n=1 Tax=Armillaria gallica TaxID=47427 RepID=A0A2H3DNC9_ARMGA|nr:DUF1445-domain-containing protein [Armillaria gallica]